MDLFNNSGHCSVRFYGHGPDPAQVYRVRPAPRVTDEQRHPRNNTQVRLSQVYSGLKQCLSRVYPGFRQSLVRVYPGFIQGLSKVYPGFIHSLCRVYLGFIHCLFNVCLMFS